MSDGDGSDAGEIGGHGGDHHGGDHHGWGDHFGDHHGHGHHGGHGWGFASVGDDADMPDGRARLISAAPRGWLPRGIDAGLAYTRETFLDAKTFSGDKAGILKCVPAGTRDMESMATVVALDVARKFGADKLSGYTAGYLWEHPTFSARGLQARGEDEDRGRLVNLGGIVRSNTTVELLAWPHDQCDWRTELRRHFKREGLVRLDLRQSSSLPDIDRIERRLLSADPFGNADDGVNPPNGWFRPVKGETHLVREFYQVRGCLSTLFGGGSNRDEEGTFLAVFGATWKFDHGNGCADYETRIAFAVFGNFYSAKGRQTYKWQKIRKHREAAEKAAAAMLGYLRRFAPAATAVDRRLAVNLAETAPVPPAARLEAPRVRLDTLPLTPIPPATGRGAGDPAGPEADERR